MYQIKVNFEDGKTIIVTFEKEEDCQGLIERVYSGGFIEISESFYNSKFIDSVTRLK